jgi:hypothetical protein
MSKTFAERQDRTFRHQPVDKIVWQPRFSDWYRQNHIIKLRRSMTPDQIATFQLKCPDLPPDVYGLELDEVYDYLDASPRYPGECWPGISFFHTEGNPDADIKHSWTTDAQGNRQHKIVTPYGTLTEGWRAGSSYPDERILKKREDFKAVLYYVENSTYKSTFNRETFELFNEVSEGRCVASGGPWRSPFNKCIVELAGTRNTMLLMKRYTAEFDTFCAELERINAEVVMPVQLASPIPYMSFGDNVDCRNNPPPVYEKYLLPYFERMVKACRQAGKFTFAHYDGDLEDLLPYMSNDRFPFDGIEAPTFYPQGNVRIEDFRKALGDRIIVLDGIPSTIFLPHYSEERFDNFVQQVLEFFSPNLILGVSDEYSPNGLFSRLRKVASIVEKFHP